MNKYKIVLTFLAIFFGIATLIFATSAFIQWDINPKNWTEDARSLCGVISLVVGGMLAGSIFCDD